MSASLVGSEMCIRDRGRSGSSGHELGPQLRKSGRTPARPDGRAHDRTPVSYTHLTLPTICSV
eukprot:11596503-Alexandrium_andersonii.AAC.1